MSTVNHYISRFPFIKVIIIFVLVAVFQFLFINQKVVKPHPADQPLYDFILGNWVAVNMEVTEWIALPEMIEFFDSNDVYFKLEFPEMYETMERNYKLNGNIIELSPPMRSKMDWPISRVGEELIIGDVTYRRAINFPWGTVAIILLICGLWGMKITSRFQSIIKVASRETSKNLLTPKWATFSGHILTPVLGWIGLEIGLEGYALTRALIGMILGFLSTHWNYSFR